MAPWGLWEGGGVGLGLECGVVREGKLFHGDLNACEGLDLSLKKFRGLCKRSCRQQ